MKFAVIQFPGSNSDQDCIHAIEVLGHQADYVWHKSESVGDVDAVLVPGGFSYGDYLRAGAIARLSPIMGDVQRFAEDNGLVLGICNGFQILCESGLLPGALIKNRSLQFRCELVYLKTATAESPFTRATPAEQVMRIPIAHGEGCFFADSKTLSELEENQQVLWRYCDEAGEVSDRANPNGSVGNIAGICNARRNVAGLMPHPERACEERIGSADGRSVFQSMIRYWEGKMQVQAA